jgi:tetratricopeptide (TPR) repeat protein
MVLIARRSAVIALLVAAAVTTPEAQAPPTPARAAAEKAWRAGQFDELDRLGQANPTDDAITVLRARGAWARGYHARAEALLQPRAAATPSSDAALELGLLQMYLGRRIEGRRTLQTVMTSESPRASARELARMARAARALGRVEDSRELFREAEAALPNDAPINTAWGELFLEKYARADAARSFQIALKTDGDNPDALLGMARAIAEDNPAQAMPYVQRLLKVNPGHVGTQLFLAEMAVDQDRKSEAREAIAKARRVNPNSLEAFALASALDYVEGRDADYQKEMAAAFKINPTYGELHRVVGAITARYYRFEEAAEHTRRAIALDRDNWRAYADLGAHLMRTGDERGARRALETAFRQDPYDVITYNLLEVLDALEPFATIKEGEMIIRLHPDEVGVMREYVPVLAREAMAALVKTWEFTPKGPILVEVFPKHDHFAVRNVGLPGMIGALGACFGRVVTMDSPRARPPGEFNWGVTLWHELAHVITLQLSNQRIPRWLTEGISVYEEKRARPEWGREMDIPFARALDRGQVLKLRDLNAGFTNPQTISLAYFEASLVVEHIVEGHGQAKLKELVQSFATGLDTEAALQKVLGVEIDAMQKTFDAFVEKRYGALQKAMSAPEGLSPDMPIDALKAMASANPTSFPAQMVLAVALQEQSPDQALPVFERAAALVPNATGDDSPNAHIARIAIAKGDKARAIKALDTLTGHDHSDVASARRLAELLDPKTQAPALKVALQRVVAVDPFDAGAHSSLGRLALAGGETEQAIRMFRVAVAAGPADKAAAQADLGEGLLQAGQKDEAKRAILSALELAPTYTRAQDLLLKVAGGGK